MARKDLIHDAVKNALIQNGWNITHDPLFVEIDDGDKTLEIDLGGEKVIFANKGIQQIAIEIKSFSSGSMLNAFHTILEQYLDYREALKEGAIDRTLYIAISDENYVKMKHIAFIQRRIEQFRLKIISVDIDNQKIIRWNE